MDFQYRVAAWIAIHILAEKDVSIPWGLPSNISLESIRLETEYPIDDILVNTSSSGKIFIQVKHSIGLDKRIDSGLASAIDQVVCQFLSTKLDRSDSSEIQSFRPDQDRMVIVTSPNSPSSITKTTSSLLDHIRNQASPLRIPQKEQRSLSILSDHISRSWKNLLGDEPTPDQIHQLLSLVYIQTLDLDRDGSDDIFCKNILRQSILKNADNVEIAWKTIISKCSELAQTRGGLNRDEFQVVMQKAGINLKVTNSFREDVDRLKEYTRFTSKCLISLSKFLVGSKEVKVERIYASKIQIAAASSHLLVVGEPGAGKSGAIYDFVELLLKQENDVVFIAVDRLCSQNLKDEIGLDNPIYKVLLNWPGVNPGFLVIDALDAARNEQTAQLIKNLIELVINNSSRWHVIASVRKFDLRHNIDLKNLFRGNPVADYMDKEFANIQHINILDFNESELDQIRSQLKEFSNFLNYDNSQLAELLKKPFNLRLIGELIGEGISINKLTPIRTQVELLSKYWFYRVIRSDKNGDARELVLCRIVSKMIKDRSIMIDRQSIVIEINTGQFLEELLSSHVLIEWQSSTNSKPDRYTLAFSHNMLFDYAVSKLIFSGSNKKIIKELEEDHELVLAVRPSIVYYFHDKWFFDNEHDSFWNAVFELTTSDKIPLIGKLIGPSVAVELAQYFDDFNFVYLKLERGDSNEKLLVEKIIQDITGAILTSLPEGSISDDQLLLWAKFTERISLSMDFRVAYSVRSILMKFCEQPKWLNQEHKISMGRAARRLLEFAWSREDVDRDQGLITHALKAVCRTYESDSIASKTIIQRSLEPDHLKKYGYQELPRLSDEMELLIINAPDLSEEIYREVFTYRETSKETTQMGGRIIGMVSTKEQDYHMAQWRLADIFQFFLEKTPIEATRALIDIIHYYIEQRHSIPDKIVETFTFGNEQAKIISDYSVIWDSGSVHDEDEPIKMLNIFTAYLHQIASNQNQKKILKQILKVIVLQNHSAVFWKKILVVGTSNPKNLGYLIRSFAWAKPVLIGLDTTTAAGNFIREIYDLLKPDEKLKVENAILSITDDIPENKNPEYFKQHRDRLLGCIADKELILEDSRSIVDNLKKSNAIPPNTPLYSIETSWSKEYTDDDYFIEQGVSLETPEHKMIIHLENQLKDFATTFQNSPPTISKADEILPKVLDLEKTLKEKSDKINQNLKDLAWGYISKACERIASIESLKYRTKLGRNIKRLLLILSDFPMPSPNPEQDAQFSKFQSWGSPAARIDAASGLILLARHKDFLDNQIKNALDKLAKDLVPAVRFQIAMRLNAILFTSPDLMWRLLKIYSTDERNDGVIKGSLHTLHRLAGSYPDEVMELAESIFNKTLNIKEADSIAQSCVSIFLGLYLWRNHIKASEIVNSLLDQTSTPISLKIHIVSQIRNAINQYINEAVRIRALDVLNKIVQRCEIEFSQLNDKLLTYGQNKSDIDALKEVINLADACALSIYFSSGAYSEKQSQKANEKILSIEEKRKLFLEISPIIKSLSQINYASVIHHLIETLEAFIPANPLEVFLLVNHVVKSGKSGHYQYESLAVDRIVAIVERYLAEYRIVIRENPECQNALLEILDIFVEAGWPNARKLTYRLEEIYR